MDRRLVSGLIAILTTGFLGQAIATDRAPLVAPVIEMVADVGPRAEDGTYTIRTDQVVVDPQGLFKDNKVLRREPLKLWPMADGLDVPEGKARLFVKSPDASAGRWRLVAVQPVTTSQPYVRDGLQITLTADRATIAADQPLTVTLHVRNVTDKPLAIHDFAQIQGWQIMFGDWRAHHLVDDDRAPAVTTVLGPDDAATLSIKLDPKTLRYERRHDSGEFEKRDQLEPGRYFITVKRWLHAPPAKAITERDVSRWTGEAICGGMPITLTKPGE